MRRAAWLGVLHGLVDAAAGFVLVGVAMDLPPVTAALLVLAWNALATLGQVPLALFCDRASGRPEVVVAAAPLAMALGLLVLGTAPVVALTLTALGSAALHAAGGGLAIAATPGSARGPGLFAAPGVIGLALGAVVAGSEAALPALALALLAAAVAVGGRDFRRDEVRPRHRTTEVRPLNRTSEVAELAVLGVVLALALRSAAWTTIDAGHGSIALGLAFAAAIGKLGGGLLVDRWRHALPALLAAGAVVLLVAAGHLAGLALGTALLQAALPVALAHLGRLLPGRPALAAALGLGAAIALGGVPVVCGLGPALGAPPWLAALLLAAALPALAAGWLSSGRGGRAPPRGGARTRRGAPASGRA